MKKMVGLTLLFSLESKQCSEKAQYIQSFIVCCRILSAAVRGPLKISIGSSPMVVWERPRNEGVMADRSCCLSRRWRSIEMDIWISPSRVEGSSMWVSSPLSESERPKQNWFLRLMLFHSDSLHHLLNSFNLVLSSPFPLFHSPNSVFGR